MREGTVPLEAAVGQLSRSHPDLRFTWSAPEAGFPSFALLDAASDGMLEAWLSATRELAPGIDRKTAASYLLSILTWQLGQVLGALYLSRLPLPRFGPEHVGVHHALVGSPGAQAIDFDFCFRFDGTGIPLDREAMSASLVALLTPMLEALHSRTRLARRAMWALIADGISAGFLSFGKRVGEAGFAMAEAEAILRRPDLPLHNTRWRFVTIEGGGRSEAFRLRGGCCRLYLGGGHPFCTTCVLRDEPDQIARLQAYLAR